MLGKWSHRWLRTFTALLLCLLPFILLGVILFTARAKFTDFHVLNTDEIDYWAEAASITRNGLVNNNAGYFGFNADGHARLLNYGAHAPFVLLPYALVGHVTASEPITIPFTNFLMLSISLLAFYMMTKSLRVLTFTTLALFLFLPFLMYFFSGMVEVLIFAGVLLILPFHQRLFGENSSGRIRVWYFIIVLVWSLFRITNLFLLTPLFLLELQESRKKGLTMLKYFFVSLAAFLILSLLSTTYPWSFIGQFLRSSTKVEFFFRHALSSAYHFLLPTEGDVFEVGLRYIYLLWFFFLGIRFIKVRKTASRTETTFLLGQVLVLSLNLAFIVAFYEFDGYRGFRMLSPILFFSVISWQMQTKKFVPKWIVPAFFSIAWIGFLVAFIPHSASFYNNNVTNRLYPSPKSQILELITFNPSPKDRWENSIYMDLFSYRGLDYEHFTPGLGIMEFRNDELDDILAKGTPDILKARYLISAETIEFPGYTKLGTDQEISLYEKIGD